MEKKIIGTNGVQLEVVLAGPQDGPPVFLLHGFPDFWFTWESQIQALVAQGFRVIVPNQRGFGKSDKPLDVFAYRQAELAADIVGIADVLGYKKFCLAGHDFGGLVAWTIATIYAERVEKLVIISAPHLIASLKYKKITQKLKSWYILFFQLPFIPERLLQAFDYAMLAKNMPSSLPKATLYRYKTCWGEPKSLRAMLQWYRAMVKELQTKEIQYGLIKIPTHIIWGQDDKYLEVGLAQLSLKQCTNGNLTIFDKTSHWVMHEQPQAVNAILIEHFKA